MAEEAVEKGKVQGREVHESKHNVRGMLRRGVEVNQSWQVDWCISFASGCHFEPKAIVFEH